MIFVLILCTALSSSHSVKEDIDEKIAKTNGKLTIEAGQAVVHLNDDELDYILYNSILDWYILFYESKTKGTHLVNST